MIIKLWLLATLLVLFSIEVNCQTATHHVNYKKEAVWIKMMDDPNANYFETVKAFREFFKERPLPKEPNDLDGNDSFEKEIGLDENSLDKKSKKEVEREKKRSNPSDRNYAEEVRAFRGWYYSIQPWVRSDGSIVSKKEQQSIIDKQQSELREIEKTNIKK